MNPEQDPQSGIVILAPNYQYPLEVAVAQAQMVLLKPYYELPFLNSIFKTMIWGSEAEGLSRHHWQSQY